MENLTDYERGMKEGRIDALLDEHTARLNKINGSVDRFAKSNEKLVETMREDAAGTRTALDLLSSAMRTMQEEGRARDLAVQVAADTLAKETERRREELATTAATTSTTWSLRSNKASVAYLLIALVAVLLTFYFGTRPGPTLSPNPTTPTK